jgi:hydrogenase/urease accessory protein HupE
MRSRALLALAAILAPVIARAHGFNPALLRLRELGGGQYEVVWKPATVGEANAIPPELQARFPAHCLERESAVTAGSTRIFTLDCGQRGLEGEPIVFSGLAALHLDAVVEWTRSNGTSATAVARPDAPAVTLFFRPTAHAVADTSFFRLGVEHILTGFDHLLFVFGLVLLVGARWRLLGTITAFTVAHSITLALTTLGLVRLPQPPVEACIAASILLLAAELARPGRDSLTRRKPWLVAFAFGLLHGFGFAAALTAAGLPPSGVPMALLLFNLGVEAGQIVFLCAVLLVLAVARRLLPGRGALIAPAGAYGIGSCAAFWLCERVAAFAGP